jgi:hypothetical protein
MSKFRLISGLMLLVLLASATASSQTGAVKPGKALLAHNVYFSLNDNSDAAKDRLIAACKKYLSGHPGTVFFAAGSLAGDLDRPVNDREFDVALHVIFESKDAHDRYQKDARHLKFIEENTANWKKVRVFDSYVNPAL